MCTRALAPSLALALALALGGACSSTPGSTDMPADSGTPATPSPPPGAGAAQPAAGLQVTVTLSPDTVREGETLRIAVTVANRGAAARSVEATSACFTDYEILDAGGAVAATSDQMCAAVMSQRTLAAGESFTDSHSWVRGMRGMPVLPPGRYEARGVLLATDGPVRSEGVPFTVAP